MIEPELLSNFNYYLDHQDELVQKYNGKYVAIADEKVVGVFDDEDKAIANTSKKYKLGTFLVHLVGPGTGNYTIKYHPGMRVYNASA